MTPEAFPAPRTQRNRGAVEATRARPTRALHVLANFAVTADGKITTRTRSPAHFSSAADKQRLLEIRSEGDAVLVGHGTVAADNMTMGLPSADLRARRLARGQTEVPLRAIVSASGRIDPSLKVFRSAGGPIHLFTTPAMQPAARSELERRGVRIHLLTPSGADLRSSARRLSPAVVLARLQTEAGVRKVVCEGGAQLFHSLVEEDLIDEVCLTWCATVFGGAQAPGLLGTAAQQLSASRALRLVSMEPGGAGEVFLRYRLSRRPAAAAAARPWPAAGRAR